MYFVYILKNIKKTKCLDDISAGLLNMLRSNVEVGVIQNVLASRHG